MLTMPMHDGVHGPRPDLGHHGISTESLIEFEGGGSMLSRHILEEILSVDENPRASERQKKAKKMRKREARFSKRSRFQIARELTKGKQAQVLCQTDGVNRREISQPTNTMGPYEVDGSRLSTTCRRAIQNHHLCFRTQRVRHPYFQLSTMEHARGASTSSPESRTPVRLYDSDGTQNPRVLRAVIDDMVLTGLAGGILKAKQSSDIDNLKRQYELACLWATELEDRLFQSQTGVPHRQLLGELRLEQEEGVTYDQERDFEKRGAKKVHELHRNSQLLIPSKPRCTKPPSSYPSWVSLSCKRKMVSSRYKSSLNLCTSMGETQASTTFKEVTPRHKNFPQPPLTPTSSLAQYISSLRPFSARGAKAAWGLAEAGERSDNPGSPLVEEPAKGYTEHTWPILFVMGNVKPSGIHPLALHTSLRFGDELLFRVAKASGESRESILAMASVLEQLDFTCLQRSVERLCHAQHTQDQLFLSRSNPEVRSRRGVRGSQMTNNAVLGAPEMGDEPVILSETSALRALTSGFLANVFGDQTIRAILEVSRPMVVFDSTDSEPSYPAGEVADIVRQDVGSSPVSLERKPSSWELQRRGLADHCRGSAMGSLGGDHNLKNDGARVDHITSSSAQCASALLSPSRSVVRNTTTSDPLGSSKFRGARQGEGILVTQLVRATIARFRVHSVALRLVYGASTGSPRAHEISEEGDAHMAEAPAPGVADSGTSRRRQAPSHTDHLGSLPPLKLQKRERGMMPARRLLAMDGSQSSATKNSAGRLDKDLSADGSVRPRSTPRCLRPGFKGKLTAVMLRQELEESEFAAARLGMAIARKAEAWTKESQAGGSNGLTAFPSVTRNSAAAGDTTALAMSGTLAQDAMVEAAKEKILVAIHRIYIRFVRRSWTAWVDVVRRARALETAVNLTRLSSAALIFMGTLEPLQRRRERAWLLRWAASMRAERVLEVQAAAVELQRLGRGFMGRARGRRTRETRAATEIQRIVRGRLGKARVARRAKFLREVQAIETIERACLNFLRRRNAARFRMRRKEEKSVIALQAAWRGLVGGRRLAKRLREARDMELSALMIERLWRGVRARMEAEVLLGERKQREAAASIQAAVRGRRARNLFRPVILRQRAAAVLSRSWRCSSARREMKGRRDRRHLALVLVPAVRGFLGRARARGIRQARHRRRQAIIQACIVAQKLLRGKRGRLKVERELLQRHAAIELQRISRGRLARRRSKLREESERRQVERRTVAVSLQKMWRGGRDRRKFRECASQRLRSVLLIQSSYRGFRSRRGQRDRIPDFAVASTAAGEGHRDGDTGKISPVGRLGPPTRETWSQTDERWDGHSHGHIRAMVSASINDREEKIMEEARHGPEDAIEIQHVSAGVDSNLDSSPRPPRGRAVFYGENNPTLTAAFRGEGNVAAEATNSSPQTMTSDSPAATSPTHEVELSPPRPATTVNEGMVSVEAPPLLEPTVEYYEAKQKYIAALERAHGASASKVQSFFRMCAAGFRANALRIKKEELRQEHEHQCRAALKLQAGARARSARKTVARKRAALEQAQRREKAAVSLQCTMRLYSAKRQLRQLREAEEARLKRMNRMAARIQARVRGVQTREIWRRFFRSRALLERERQRVGARRIQGMWRSKLARTELERRKGVRDEALLAQELERHLESILQGVMEAERRHAYAVRLQCWWRRITSRKIKSQKAQRESKEESTVPDEEGEQRAALAIQTNWRRYQARSFFINHFTALFNQRERKKYCTECQGQYATRTCDTCIDKFCERCWAYMHSKGERRFHHWKPFSPFTYEVVRPGGETNGEHPGSSQDEGVGYSGYNVHLDGRALTSDDGTSVSQYQENIGYTTEQHREIDIAGTSGDGTWAEGTWEGANGWMSAPAQGSAPSYGVRQDGVWGNDWYHHGGTSAAGDATHDYPSTGWGQEWTEYYGSASQYPDDSSWSQQAAGDLSQFDRGGGSGVAGQTYQPWGGNTQEVQQQLPAGGSGSQGGQAWESGYYAGYEGEGGVTLDPTLNPYYAVGTPGVHGEGAMASEEWATCDGTYGADVFGFSVHPASGEDMNDPVQECAIGGDASDGLWSVNEFGQRVSGDWVEYWDESAQATYFYNNATGEASWTEPVLG